MNEIIDPVLHRAQLFIERIRAPLGAGPSRTPMQRVLVREARSLYIKASDLAEAISQKRLELESAERDLEGLKAELAAVLDAAAGSEDRVAA